MLSTSMNLNTRFRACWLLVLGYCLSSALHASAFYVYRAPNGERVVTDRAINMPGYELEHSRLDANRTARALRGESVEISRLEIERHIRSASFSHNLDPALIRAVIRQESNFQVDALSVKGAQGLMQLMPGTARYYGVTNPWDPRQNILAGSRHLSYLLTRYNDLDLALAAYNAGETAVERYQGIPPFPETQNYVEAVKRWYDSYR
ncbi:MAG: lytic transglycosylase domain-containing protein [Saccharospirillum sp.]